jgi:microcystin degradation protein MlrC
VGATVDARYSGPVAISGEVIHLSGGKFIAQGPAFAGREFSMGRTAVILIGKIRLVVASTAIMMIDPALFRSQGIEPADQDVVGIKSPSLFRPNYESISRSVVYLDLPGPCYGRIEKVPFRKINRPIFPLDQFEWEPSDPQRFVSRVY